MMPESATRPSLSDLALSPAFKRCQRALAQWLEGGADGSQAPFAARQSLHALSAAERGQIARWLGWLGYAAQRNGQPTMLARVTRVQARFDPSTAVVARGKRSARPLVMPGLLRSA